MKIDWFKIGAIVVAVFSTFMWYKECNKTSTEKEQVSLVNALQDTLQTLRLENGSQKAFITTIKTEQVSTFTSLNIKDKEIQDLQAVVKEYKNKLKAGSSVSIGNIQTNINHENPTTITKVDTVHIGGFTYVFPEYSDSLVNHWITYHSKANKLKSSFTLKMNHEFSAVVGSYKGVPFADITSKNPYDSITNFRTYQVTMPKVKRWGIGLNLSAGISGDFKIRPFIGLGVQYSFIKF